jgi:hypothetical protein
MSQFNTHPTLSPVTAMPNAGAFRFLTRTVWLLLLTCLSMVFPQSAIAVLTLRASDLVVVVDFQQDDTDGFTDTADVVVNLTSGTGEFQLRVVD